MAYKNWLHFRAFEGGLNHYGWVPVQQKQKCSYENKAKGRSSPRRWSEYDTVLSRGMKESLTLRIIKVKLLQDSYQFTRAVVKEINDSTKYFCMH